MRRIILGAALCCAVSAFGQSDFDKCQQNACYGYRPPQGVSQNGMVYRDLSTTPPTLYCAQAGGWGICSGSGSGSGTVSGQASNVIPLGTNATTVGAQSHIDENTAGITHISQPVKIDGTNHGASFGAAPLPAPTASAGGIFADPSGNLQEYDNGGSFSRLCTAGNSQCVTSLNSLVGALSLVAGTGIAITPSGSNITIAATGGSSNQYVVPRDNHWLRTATNVGNSRVDTQGGALFINANSTAGAGPTYADDANSIPEFSLSTTTATTNNAVPSWTDLAGNIRKFTSGRISFGMNNANIDVWLLHGTSYAAWADIKTHTDPSLADAVTIIGFRYYAGTDTHWVCYVGDGTHAGQTADSGVTPTTTGTLSTFDVFVNQTTHVVTYSIDGAQVCSITESFTMPNAGWRAGFTFQNTTATAVVAYNGEIYAGTQF